MDRHALLRLLMLLWMLISPTAALKSVKDLMADYTAQLRDLNFQIADRMVDHDIVMLRELEALDIGTHALAKSQHFTLPPRIPPTAAEEGSTSYKIRVCFIDAYILLGKPIVYPSPEAARAIRIVEGALHNIEVELHVLDAFLVYTTRKTIAFRESAMYDITYHTAASVAEKGKKGVSIVHDGKDKGATKVQKPAWNL